MQQLFTVSRHDISGFEQLKLNNNFEAMPFVEAEGLYDFTESRQLIQEVFDEGVSKHGERYLLNRYEYVRKEDQYFVSHLPSLEIILELVRRWRFPTLPSRFASAFGWETLKEAVDFRASHCQGNGKVYLVGTESYIKRDMSLLFSGHTALGNMLLADKYWRGESTTNPVWECLLRFPVNVLEEVA